MLFEESCAWNFNLGVLSFKGMAFWPFAHPWTAKTRPLPWAMQAMKAFPEWLLGRVRQWFGRGPSA